MKELLSKMFVVLKNQKADYDITIFVRTLALSLISIFLPIYLLDKGSAFLLLAYIVGLGVAYPLVVVLATYSLRKFSGLGSLSLSLVLFILGLKSVEMLTLPSVVFASFILKLSELLFWFPLHVEFPDIMGRGKRKNFTLVLAILLLTPFLGPVVGAKVVDLFGYDNLFNFAILIYSSLLIPQAFIKERFRLEFPKFRFNIFYFMEGWQLLALTFLWPAFLFYMGWERDAIAVLFSFISLSGGVVAMYASFYKVQIDKKKLFSISYITHGIGTLARVSTEALNTYFGGLLGFISYVFYKPLFMESFYKKVAKQRGEILTREINLGLGTFTCAILVFSLSFLVGFSKALAFSIASAGLFSFVFASSFRL